MNATCARYFPAYTIAMKPFLLLATLAYTQQGSAGHDNYYTPARDAQVGERFITQLQAAGITATPEPRQEHTEAPSADIYPVAPKQGPAEGLHRRPPAVSCKSILHLWFRPRHPTMDAWVTSPEYQA